MGYGWDWKNHMDEDPKERAKYGCGDISLKSWERIQLEKPNPKDKPEDDRILIRYPDYKGYEYALVHEYGGYILGEDVVHRVGCNKDDDEGYDFGIALDFESVEAMLVDWARDKGNYERVEDFLDEYFGGEETNYISESFSIKDIGEEIQTLQEILEIVQKKEKNLEGVLGVKI